MSELDREGGPFHAAAVALYGVALAFGVWVDAGESAGQSSLLPSATIAIATLTYGARPWLRELVPEPLRTWLDPEDLVALAAGCLAAVLGLAYLAVGWRDLVVWSHVGGGALAVAVAVDAAPDGADPKYDLIGLAGVVVALAGVYLAATRGLATRPVLLIVGGVGLFALEQAEVRRESG